MDIRLSNIRYDKDNEQILCSIGNQHLTIPDYMTIKDIQYFLNEKIVSSVMSSLNFVQAKAEAENNQPLDKALEHYKQLGWDFDVR